MKKFIVSFLASLLIVGCSVDTMTMDDTGKRIRRSKLQFFVNRLFQPMKIEGAKELRIWWFKNTWKRYICSKSFDVREYHRDKIEKSIYGLECRLSKKSNFLCLSLNFDYKKPIYDIFYGHVDISIESKIKDCIQKNCTGNLDVADISPIYVSKSFYVQYLMYYPIDDIIYIPNSFAVDIEKGHQQLLEWIASGILHEHKHKEKLHGNKREVYHMKLLKMKQSDSFDDKTDIDQMFAEYTQIQEREADILACIEGGPKMCGWLRDFLVYIADKESMMYEKMVEAGIETDCIKKLHPPIQERIDYLEPIISDMKTANDPNKCFNPYDEINGLPRWVDCDGYK